MLKRQQNMPLGHLSRDLELLKELGYEKTVLDRYWVFKEFVWTYFDFLDFDWN